jgi:formylglycine-generating enzyme required for sulfatase activity
VLGGLGLGAKALLSEPPPAAVPYATVELAPGQFSMGSPDAESGRAKDEAQHPVTLTRKVAFGKTEVTQALWWQLMHSKPSGFLGDDLPVEGITWDEAIDLANKLSARDGYTPAYTVNAGAVTWNPDANGWRLPTEAEWEAAARGGGTTVWAGSDKPADVAWVSANANGRTHPAGTLAPNALGLYDMSGNVAEWTWDWYGAYDATATDPKGPDQGESRVYRGGSWSDDDKAARVAARRSSVPAGRLHTVGVRLVRTVR